VANVSENRIGSSDAKTKNKFLNFLVTKLSKERKESLAYKEVTLKHALNSFIKY
jgi:hypothetical protein